jgi:hypothetical protein
VIDLKAKPPAVIATFESDLGATGGSINRAGTLALVANYREGTVSVFTAAGNKLTPAGKADLGDDLVGKEHCAELAGQSHWRPRRHRHGEEDIAKI